MNRYIGFDDLFKAFPEGDQQEITEGAKAQALSFKISHMKSKQDILDAKHDAKEIGAQLVIRMPKTGTLVEVPFCEA